MIKEEKVAAAIQKIGWKFSRSESGGTWTFECPFESKIRGSNIISIFPAGSWLIIGNVIGSLPKELPREEEHKLLAEMLNYNLQIFDSKLCVLDKSVIVQSEIYEESFDEKTLRNSVISCVLVTETWAEKLSKLKPRISKA